MISACSFVDQLRGLGYSQYAGVPCSFLTSLINYVSGDPALDYIGATSEGEAIGITFGAFLAGRKTVTMCQNSGLGNMVNPLTSLNYPFRVPTLLVVTWRGQPEVRTNPNMNRWEGFCTVCSRPWKYRVCLFLAAKRILPKQWRRPRRAWSNESGRLLWLCKKALSPRTLCRVASSPSRSRPICKKTSQQRRMSDSRGQLQSNLFSMLSPGTKRSLLRLARP